MTQTQTLMYCLKIAVKSQMVCEMDSSLNGRTNLQSLAERSRRNSTNFIFIFVRAFFVL